MNAIALHSASFSKIREVYQSLNTVEAEARHGFYRVSFIGPWWLRKTAAPGLSLSGFSGWQGKKFLTSETATNILQSKQGITEKFIMQCTQVKSAVDGRISVALSYDEHAPLPWRWVTDELRQLDENTWLCMTVVNLPILKYFPLPFLLEKDGDAHV